MQLVFYSILVFALGMVAIVTHRIYGKPTMQDDLHKILHELRDLHRKVNELMALSAQLKTSVDANTAAVTALVNKPAPPPATDVTPDADVQAAITQIDLNSAAANAAATPPAV